MPSVVRMLGVMLIGITWPLRVGSQVFGEVLLTLVVAGINENAAFMISDVIVSTHMNLWQSGKEISYPTKPKAHTSERMIAIDLVQKITEVCPGLYIGCSGDAACANRFVNFLRQAFSNRIATKQILDQAYSDYFSFHGADEHLFSTLTLFQDEEHFYLMPHGNVRCGEIPELGQVFIIGSGASVFMKYLGNLSPEKRMAGINLHENLRVVSYVTEYVMNIMAIQNTTGLGISDGWGGAFELVVCQENHLLKKLNNIMFVYLEWDEHDGRIRAFQVGKKYFQYYEERDLIVISQYGEEAADIHAILPVDASTKSGRTYPTAHVPQMLCMLFIDRKTRKTYTRIEYNQNGHEFCGVDHSEAGGYTVKFNTQKIKAIIDILRS